MNPAESQTNLNLTTTDSATPRLDNPPGDPTLDLGQDSKSNTSIDFANLRLDTQFLQAMAADHTIDGFSKTVAAIIEEHSDNVALWISKRDEDGAFRQIHEISNDNAYIIWQLVESECRTVIQKANSSNSVCNCSVENYPHYEIIVAPVVFENSAEYVIVGCFSTKKQTVIRQLWLMGMVGQSFTNWVQQRKLEQTETKSRSLNDALSLIQCLDQTTDIRHASMAIVNHLSRLCESEQVAICYCPNGTKSELSAISNVERIELSSESNKLISHACNLAIIVGKTLMYPDSEGDSDASLRPLAQYCKANRLPGCINLPLIKDDGDIVGAILIALSTQRLEQPGFPEYLEQMAKLITGHLNVVLRANRGFSDLAKARIGQIRRAQRTMPILLGIVLSMALLCVPWPYRIACDCEVQPVLRRFIAAPYEGILEKTLVQHGDLVEMGQILAHMNGRQVRIQLVGLKAEFEGARKRRDSALAKSDYATSQIARSEMKRLQSKIDLLEQRVVNLEIRSPIDGIIVSGDLEKVEGAPLELGQTLFEVGPLDKMLAEVSVPESEIPFVESGMEVLIKLNAYPFRKWRGEIRNIHPRAEIVNDESVFMAQVELPNAALLLRPGLKGTAKIRSNAHPIGWNLFHRAWEPIRYWMIW